MPIIPLHFIPIVKVSKGESMSLRLGNYGLVVFVIMLLVLPSWCFSQDTYVSSRATFYGSPDCLGTQTGACGFGDYGRTINGGVVSGVSKLYKNGTGCGACYQVRCKAPQHCTEDGVKLVVTDYGEGDHTDFILSLRAYSNLALPNMAAGLFAAGVVDIEYRRISCQYPGYNLVFKVHEHSRFPEYLALVPLYQAGANEITAVELWQEDCKEWRALRKAYGAVWDMPNPPTGDQNLRFQVRGSAGVVKWVQLKNVIPGEWKAGATYDTAIQLN